jgi:hypothetical protein
MAESSKEPNPWGLWPLLAVFLVVSGYIQLMPKLESSRPAQEKAGLDKAEPGQAVRARLWEDPLSAVAEGAGPLSNNQPARSASLPRLPVDAPDTARKSKPEQGDGGSRGMQASLKKTLGEFKAKNKLGSDTQILALAAMIDGGPYPEDFETRQRTRQAVLSALGAEKFVPHDADHLEYFIFEGRDQPAHPMYVPFEWYEPVDDKCHRLVLLLWVNESEIKSGYLGWMTELSKQLNDVLATQGSPGLNVRVLGPSNSDVLQSMADEAIPKTLVGGIYSAQSTADSARAKTANGAIGGIPIQFVIGTDRDLATALDRELHLRNCCTAKFIKQIAVIAEWDTLYGQDMFQVFEDVFPTCTFCGAKAGLDEHFHRSTYFQGIDGRLPGDKRTGQSDEKTGQDSTIWKEPLPGRPGSSVPAVGYSRIDYLRRTVEHLKRENSNWKAIGVVGSDVYDKILLIRVLKYYFPGTILFTTDLDARLLDPAEYPSTRNMLIASHYGLELREDLQRDIQPFRSVYQTSEFLATIRAIRDTRDPKSCNDTGHQAALTLKVPPHLLDPAPVVFEIGRAGPFPLEYQRSGKAIQSIANVHPRYFERSFWPYSPIDWPKAVLLAAAVLLGMILSIGVYSRYRGSDSSRNAWKWLLGLVAAVVIFVMAVSLARAFDFSVVCNYYGYFIVDLVVLVSVLYILVCYSHESLKSSGDDSKDDLTYWLMWIVGGGFVSIGLFVLAIQDHLQPAGEPLRLLDGISTWPSEFMRLVALFFAVGSIYSVFRHLQKSDKTAKKFFSNESTFWPSVVETGDQSRNRVKWVAIMAVCYLIFGTSLYFLLDMPGRPVRGDFNDATDRVLSMLSVIATVGLLFFVVDATVRAEKFVRTLRKVKSKEWLEEKLNEWAGELGFKQSDGAPGADLWSSAVSSVLEVRLTAKLTSDVGPLIYYPAAALVLMFLSRNRVFDNWDWPAFLAVIFAVGSSAVIACGVSLRVTADRARRHAIKCLEKTLSNARQVARGQDNDRVTPAVQAAIDHVKAIGEGAYSSIFDNPIVRAVLIPLAGLAGLMPLLGKALGMDE